MSSLETPYKRYKPSEAEKLRKGKSPDRIAARAMSDQNHPTNLQRAFNSQQGTMRMAVRVDKKHCINRLKSGLWG
jgi:16S rRNA G527 N7-methylase RsmG